MHAFFAGHKRIVDCAELAPPPPETMPAVVGVSDVAVGSGAGAVDPPAPPPMPDDVLFTTCEQARRRPFCPLVSISNRRTLVLPRQAQDKHREKPHNEEVFSQANGWVVKSDGTVRNANTSVAAEVRIRDPFLAPLSSESKTEICRDRLGTHIGKVEKRDVFSAQVCLTLDGPAQQFQFVSVKPCRAATDKGAAQQRWKFPWKAGQPALAFAGNTDDKTINLDADTAASSGVNGTDASNGGAGLAAASAQQCIQILGDSPWTGQRAIIWDCQGEKKNEKRRPACSFLSSLIQTNDDLPRQARDKRNETHTNGVSSCRTRVRRKR